MSESKHPFEFQAPTEEMIEKIKEIRASCKALYEVILTLPNSRERSLAITKLQEVGMWANACIVFEGAVPPHFG